MLHQNGRVAPNFTFFGTQLLELNLFGNQIMDQSYKTWSRAVLNTLLA
jgi:hypothetical protein